MAFVDNESAKEALVKGTSHDAHFRSLLLQIGNCGKGSEGLVVDTRVPSHSNPSDGPSRGDDTLVTSS